MDFHKRNALNLKFTVLFLDVFFVSAIYGGFWPSIMRDLGYSFLEIDLLASVRLIASIIWGAVISSMVDRFNRPDLFTIGLYAFYFLSTALIFFLDGPKWAVILYYVFAMGTITISIPLIESWIFRLEKDYPELDYGRIRGFGSLFYAFAGVVIGLVIDRFGYASTSSIAAICAVLLIPFVLSLPLPHKGLPAEKELTAAKSLNRQMKSLLKDIGFLLLVFINSFESVSFWAVSNKYSLFVEEKGGTSFHSGLGIFVLAFSEFVVIYSYSKLSRHRTPVMLYAVGAAFTFVRAWVLGMAKTPMEAVLFIALNGLSFGLTMPSKAALVNSYLDGDLATLGWQMFNNLSGILQALIMPLCGYISDRFTMSFMFRVFSVFSVLSTMILIFWNRKYGNKSEII